MRISQGLHTFLVGKGRAACLAAGRQRPRHRRDEQQLLPFRATLVQRLMRCLLDKVAEQILFDLWRADFPNTTIDEEVMNIDEGQKNRGTKR